MTCKYCGNQLSIEDAACPFCGQENEAAKKHTREMRHFSRQFRQTKSAAMEETGKIKALMPLLILIGVLAAANILVLTMGRDAYHIEASLHRWKVNRQETSYYNRLSQMEEEDRFLELGILYQREELYSADSLKEFTVVAEAGIQYGSALEHAGTIAVGREAVDESIYTGACERIGNSVWEFYQIIGGAYYSYLPEAREGSHGEALGRLERKMELLLTGICGLTDEEVAELEEMDAQKLSGLIRQRMEARYEEG